MGQPNTETTRNLAKLFVIEALKQERRIQKIVGVDVSAAPGERQRIRILLSVLPIASQSVLDLGPFSIDLT